MPAKRHSTEVRAVGAPRSAAAELSNAGLTRPQYGDLVASDEVHETIRNVGREIRNVVAQHLTRHGTEAEQVIAGVSQFGPSRQSRRILNKENRAARLAYETGVYIVWRCTCPSAHAKRRQSSGAEEGVCSDFCARIGYDHRCFCGHTLASHAGALAATPRTATLTAPAATPSAGSSTTAPVRRTLVCEEAGCGCAQFRYIPNTPEEIGEGWLTRRANWDARRWSAKCRCGHGHLEHDPRTLRCRTCSCSHFVSHFLCVVCDEAWEAHETVVETEDERRRAGLPVREDFFPLTEVPWGVRERVLQDPTGGGALQVPSTRSFRRQTAHEAAEQRRRGFTVTELPDHAPQTQGSATTTDTATDDTPEYCPHCATIFRSTESKFCAKCGRPRQGSHTS